MKSIRHATLVLLAVALVLPAAAAQEALDAPGMRSAPWSDEAIGLAESLPIQDGGRVKPMHTYAGFTLLRLNGKRSLKTPQGERLTPVEWFLDVLFFPEAAETYETFLVQNDEVIAAIGLPLTGKKKRDRYSFQELRPGIPRLFELAHEYGQIDEKERTSVQQQLFMLAGNVNYFMQVLSHMDFARVPIPVGPGEELSRLFEGRSEVSFADVVAELGPLRELYTGFDHDPHGEHPAELTSISTILRTTSDLASGTEFLAMIPPVEPIEEEPEWLAPADLLLRTFERGSTEEEHLAVLGRLEGMATGRSDAQAFASELASLHGVVTDLAGRRGEYEKVGLELTYYKSKVLDYGQYLFVLSFLTMAFMWLRPRSKVLYGLTSAGVLGATGFLVAGIVLRCMIRGRPPVSTLYETVLFVTAVGVLVAMFIELVNRQRVAISAAALLGVIGLFIANGYEVLDKRDTMPSLVAVLDTNFWLATHVTAITIGYSAGMLAALLASVYLIAKALGVKRDDRAFYRNLGRMVYGVLCFGLIFSVVGTILGGIWANDSWGRFWGWDPKENGALLIVISQIVILHARMGGYLREHGVCMAAALGGTVIAFSWWGVNLLGVGLHSYGFTSGISTAVWTYYGLQWGIVGLGALTWLRGHGGATA